MKPRLIFSCVFAVLFSANVFAQTAAPTYYVTIGVYGIQNYAIKYTEAANKNNVHAEYALNPKRNLYYVYLLATSDKSQAIALMLKTRVETEYKECWVFSGTLGGTAETTAPVEKPVVKEEPAKEVPIVKEEPIVTQPVVKEEPKPEEKVDTVAVIAPIVRVDSSTLTKPVEPKPVEVKHDGKPFYFKMISQQSGAEVLGEVHVQESVKATQYQAFRSNEIVYIKAPINGKTYSIVTQAPGYRPVKSTIVYAAPGVTQGDKNEFIIPIDLVKAKTGDYIDFNKLKFVRNSSIMTGDSQSELDGLVLLMKENPKYRIVVHGHCNGKQTREIVTMGSSTQYFMMDPANNKKETTSAIVLSDERAHSVKNYMVSQGIDGDRIKTKAEGGRIPLYSENSTLASYNDRVEIEIKKN